MTKLFRAFLFALCAVTFISSPTFSAEDTDQQQVPEFKVPDDVQSDGSFRYSLPFNIPEFRGLVPNVGISYNSSFKGHGSAAVWMGAGWRLTGLSSIERVTIGGGTPTYNDARDLYRLDGTELLACDDAGAINPWPSGHDYPDRYKTENPSASCTGGGNLAPIVENYRRIEMKQEAYGGGQVDYFVVTAKDGTQYRYDSLGVLAGDTLDVVADNYGVLFQRKFLLSEIRDTQATPNVVAINYYFASALKARAHRPSQILYGNGYRIGFLYHDIIEPLSTYATGTTGYMGSQTFRLSGVTVRDGAEKIRAYGFEYTQSAQSETHLLTRIRSYGSDYTLSGNDITGGSELPSPLQNLTYSADQTSFTEQDYQGEKFHRGMKASDVDMDGQEELIFPKVFSQPVIFYDTVMVPEYNLPSDLVDFGFGRQLLPSTINPHIETMQIGDPPEGEDGVSWQRENIIGFSGYQPDDGKSYFFTELRENLVGGRDGAVLTSEVKVYDLNSASGATASMPIDPEATAYIGHFDTDSRVEILLPHQGWSPFGKFSLNKLDNGAVQFSSNLSDLIIETFIDIDGDGVSEILAPNSTYTPLINLGTSCPAYGWLLTEIVDGAVTSGDVTSIGAPNACFEPLPNTPIPATDKKLKMAYGDVNGDGAADLIMFNIRYGDSERVYVSLSSGSGFEPAVLWADSTTFPILGAHDWFTTGYTASSFELNDGGSIQLKDVNGDGLDDLIISQGNKKAGAAQGENRFLKYGAQPAYIFLSNGTSFVPLDGSASGEIQDFVGIADVDGDGLVDAVAEKELSENWSGSEIRHSRIYYNSGVAPNLLTSLTDSKGGITNVEYAPSTSSIAGNNNNRVPGVYQLVAAIERENGRGDSRRTTFSYVNSKYDYYNRKPLGYQTVTAYLPAIAGEAEGPKVITTYLNDHMAEHGRVKSRIVTMSDTTTWSKRINDWLVITSGNGPYRAQKTQTRVATRYGDDLIETKKSYTYDVYGNPVNIVDYGFSDSLTGANIEGSDDAITRFAYSLNLADYIVKLPMYKRHEQGSVTTTSWANDLSFESFTYDGAPNASTAPTHGNLTKILAWTGDPNTPNNRRTVQTLSHDDFGNVLSETDARGNTVTHTYDAAKHLFRTGSTNALGHSTLTGWDNKCQAPLAVTDANAQVMSYEYDIFCRETEQSFANGQYVRTAYEALGNPLWQRIAKWSRSASNVSGQLNTYTYEFFDGFGEVHKVSNSGKTAAVADRVVVLTRYDARGNTLWTSNPMSWADAANNDASPSERTNFEYDTLGRNTKTTYPDASYSQTDMYVREVSRYGTPLSVPALRTRDADCFDNNPTTLCSNLYRLFDSQGNVIREDRYDHASTDVNAGAGTIRATAYYFDLRGNLTIVTDPAGARWDYTYDVFGNRTMASDPDLGTWTLSYDANNNLISQFDAKGQEIRFAYDALNRVTSKGVYHSNGSLQAETLSTYDQPDAAYSNIGQLTQLAVGGNTIRYHYNKTNGQLQQEIYTIDGQTYPIDREFKITGDLDKMHLPNTPGSTAGDWLPVMDYDAANRLTSFAGHISGLAYDLRSNPTQATFGNGASESRSYSPTRGWIDRIDVLDASLTRLDRTDYTRSASGRVSRQTTTRNEGKFDYAYDYTGRLLTATNFGGAVGYDQTFTYDTAGSMRSNSALGTYDYGAVNAAHPHAPTAVGFDQFTYDANGNMETGLDGKVMTYDAENRPLSVSHNGTTTTYVYGPDGTRIKKIEGAETTTYFGPVEIRKFGQGAAEEIILYPHPNVRIVNGVASFLHTDQLGSVRVMTGADGASDKETTYRPFGETVDTITDPTAMLETKGFIGERFDMDAGLQYLNARYYDPKLGMFIQPDWFEVTRAGVGTNRYAYSFNDPVNLRDPGGNVAGVDDLAFLGIIFGTAAIELGTDILNDGEINGNGPLSGTTMGVITAIGNILTSDGEESPKGLSSGHPGLDAIFGGFDGSKGRAGQSYPGSLEGLNGKLEGYAEGVPGAKHGPTDKGGYQVELPDGTKISTYPGRSKSNTDKPGYQVTKPGQKPRHGIKGTIEGDDTESEDDESSGEKDDTE